jgi:arabinofuranosyltransferase
MADEAADVDAPFVVPEDPSRSSDASPGRNARWWLNWVLLAAPLVLLAWTGWAQRHMIDDGFIYLRVIKEIRAGNGPVFNVGQRVEAFTSPAWVALLTIFSFLPFKLEWVAVCLGLGLSVAGVALALAGAHRLTSDDARDSLFVPVGALVFVSVFAVSELATTGMETGLTFAWEGLCLWLLARWATAPEKKLDARSAIVIGLGWVIRPEMLLYSGVFAAVLLAANWRTDRMRDRARLIGLMFAIPIAYQVFRMGYYGSIVTNTAIAKEGALVRWDKGVEYLAGFVRPYKLWWQLSALAVGAYLPLAMTLRRRRESRCALVVAAFVVAGVLNAVYITRVGGDWLHARLLLPAFFALCAPVAVVPITKRYLGSVVLAFWVLVVGTGLRPPGFQQDRLGRVTVADFYPKTTTCSEPMCVSPRTLSSGPVIYYEHWYPIELRRVRATTAPGVRRPTVALVRLGVTSYALGPDWNVLDQLGLADPLTAHLKLIHRGPTGHEKPLPEYWTVARLTTQDANLFVNNFPFFIPPMVSPSPAHLDRNAFAQQVEWARADLQCGAIRKLAASTDAPLTVGRFFSNVLHSYQNTKLRIPPDAGEANQQFCGHH